MWCGLGWVGWRGGEGWGDAVIGEMGCVSLDMVENDGVGWGDEAKALSIRGQIVRSKVRACGQRYK